MNTRHNFRSARPDGERDNARSDCQTGVLDTLIKGKTIHKPAWTEPRAPRHRLGVNLVDRRSSPTSPVSRRAPRKCATNGVWDAGVRRISRGERQTRGQSD